MDNTYIPFKEDWYMELIKKWGGMSNERIIKKM